MSEWAKLKVVNLKAELKKRGLPQAGLKSELVARIEEFDAAQQAESSHHEPEPAAQGDAPQTANDNDNATHHEEPASNGMVESDVVVEASAAREQDLVGGSDGSNAAEEILQSEDTSAPIEPERAPEAEKEPEQQAPEQEVVHESEQQQPEQAAEHKSEEQRPEQEMKQEPEQQQQQQQQQQQPKQEVEQELEQPQQQETEPEPISAPMVDKAPSQDRDPVVTETAQDQDEDVIMEDAGSATEEPQTASFHPESPPRAAPVPVEPSQLESQKRKRRSTSPVPQDEDIARKRARATSPSPVGQHNTSHYLPDVDYDRHVEPSIHPATSALYINNLMRPLRPADLRAHIVALAAAPGSPPDDDIVIKFHLDFIRTHALICLSSVSAASRVRQLLHGRVWPNESNRKALHIDFIPPDKMDSWIAMEESGGRRAATRWEVTYTPSADGSTIHADLVTASLSYSSSSNRPLAPPPSSRLPPSASAILPRDSVNSAPLGPRGYTDRLDAYNTPPTGPRGSGPRRQTATNSPSYQPPGEEQYTHTQPAVAFSLVSEDLAEKRLANMRSYYVRDKRPLGREINRYSFEDGFSFVDRGREIFEGIRPPHRERGGGGGGGGRGGMRGDGGRGRRGVGGGSGGSSGGYRSRSDRYIPGGGREESYRRRY